MWIYNEKEIDESLLEGFIGFVYKITNLKTNRIYIGKKLLKFSKTKKVKGKKKKFLVDSDWKQYWGSNKVLSQDVLDLGEENFTREIIRLCKMRGEMSYFEAKLQFDLCVLESDKYYNEWIMVKIHKSHLKKVLTIPNTNDIIQS